MLKVLLVLFIGLSNLPKTTPCVAQWGQCGGLEYTGETDCCAPTTCQVSNPWYSQCLQGTTQPTTTQPTTTPSTTTQPPTTTISTTTQASSNCNTLYSQCNGQNWSGSTCCIASTCTYSNPYYSQCLPSSSSSSSSSSTSSTSSSSTIQSSSSTAPSSTPTASTSPSTIQSSSSTASSSTPTVSTSSSSTSSTNQGCSIIYAQCGGIGWTGATTCCSGSGTTCSYLNDYYWQCLPTGGSSSSSSSSSSESVSSTTTVSSSGNVGGQAGITTRYWDCCKASCGWAGKASVTNPVETCAQDGHTPVDVNTQSVCSGGSAYMCNNQQPWNVSSTLSYGYAAADISGEGESDWCCACYALTFTSGPVVGKVMIVQVTNTGGDLGNNQFDLQMPGGGFGLFDGCIPQFGSSYQWGAQYGGVSSRDACQYLPPVLQSGCYWRFDWFMDANNPTMNFVEVTCPSVLTANTQCVRQ